MDDVVAELLQEIEAEIAGAKTATARQGVGVIREIGDGVARVEGLADAMLNEMLDFGRGITGLALNLDETEVGVIVLGDYTQLREGDEVRATGPLLQVPVGKGLLGRVVNTLGEPLDGKGPVPSTVAYPVEKLAPGIIRRRPVSQPVQTGIMSIDAMIPIGRGQRELIIGDRATGKSTIAVDTIINNARINKANEGKAGFRPLYSIYVGIGQKNSNIARTIGVLEDLSKHAVAYRQVSLLLKRPSGREAYPGDVFYLHSRLLERSARVNEKYVEKKTGGKVKGKTGSLTRLPIIETQAGDVTAFVPTNVISITHRQIFLEGDLFKAG